MTRIYPKRLGVLLLLVGCAHFAGCGTADNTPPSNGDVSADEQIADVRETPRAPGDSTAMETTKTPPLPWVRSSIRELGITLEAPSSFEGPLVSSASERDKLIWRAGNLSIATYSVSTRSKCTQARYIRDIRYPECEERRSGPCAESMATAMPSEGIALRTELICPEEAYANAVLLHGTRPLALETKASTIEAAQADLARALRSLTVVDTPPVLSLAWRTFEVWPGAQIELPSPPFAGEYRGQKVASVGGDDAFVVEVRVTEIDNPSQSLTNKRREMRKSAGSDRRCTRGSRTIGETPCLEQRCRWTLKNERRRTLFCVTPDVSIDLVWLTRGRDLELVGANAEAIQKMQTRVFDSFRIAKGLKTWLTPQRPEPLAYRGPLAIENGWWNGEDWLLAAAAPCAVELSSGERRDVEVDRDGRLVRFGDLVLESTRDRQGRVIRDVLKRAGKVRSSVSYRYRANGNLGSAIVFDAHHHEEYRSTYAYREKGLSSFVDTSEAAGTTHSVFMARDTKGRVVMVGPTDLEYLDTHRDTRRYEWDSYGLTRSKSRWATLTVTRDGTGRVKNFEISGQRHELYELIYSCP